MPKPKTKTGRKRKVHKVMGEFKRGTLHSSSGDKVTSRDQAVAIAMSEAGMSKPQKSTKGSRPFTKAEVGQGFRRINGH